MKKIFCILSILTIISPALADITPTTNVVTTSYVQGAYDAITSAKQDKLTSTNVTTTGSGAVVTGVSASNGSVTVTTGEVQIPVGTSASNITGHAAIWIQ